MLLTRGDHESLGKTLPRDFIMALQSLRAHGVERIFPDNDEMDYTHASQVTVPPEELKN